MSSITFRSVVSAVLLLIVLVSVESKVITQDGVREIKARSLAGVSSKVVIPVEVTVLLQAVQSVQTSFQAVLTATASLSTSINAILKLQALLDVVTQLQSQVQNLAGATPKQKKGLVSQVNAVGSTTTQLSGLTADLTGFANINTQLTAVQANITATVNLLLSLQTGLTASALAEVTVTLDLVQASYADIEVQVGILQGAINGSVTQLNVQLNTLVVSVTGIGSSANVKPQTTKATTLINSNLAVALGLVFSVNSQSDTQLSGVLDLVSTASGDVVAALVAEVNVALNLCLCLSSITGR